MSVARSDRVRKKRSLKQSQDTDIKLKKSKNNKNNLYNKSSKRQKTNKNNKNKNKSEEEYSSEDEYESELDDSESSEDEFSSNFTLDSDIDLSEYKVNELRIMCRDFGLKSSGKKDELIFRLSNPTDENSKPKRRTTFSLKEVNNKLKTLGINPKKLSTYFYMCCIYKKVPKINRVGMCFKAGVGRGYIKLTDDKNILNKVIYIGNCYWCSDDLLETRIRDVLYQSDNPINEWNGIANSNHSIFCNECNNLNYLSMCDGDFAYSNGKYFKHCNKCIGYGKCIGNSRDDHCYKCNKHYFCGSMGDIKCNCEEEKQRQRAIENILLSFM